jgi:hypothetical protein
VQGFKSVKIEAIDEFCEILVKTINLRKQKLMTANFNSGNPMIVKF